MSDYPNIVVAVLDACRASSLPMYGNDRIDTPYMSKIAEEGTVVDHCISQSIWTLPSHASMLTGLYPHQHDKNHRDHEGPLFNDTFPDKLSDEGYRTVGVSNNPFFSPAYGFDNEFDEFELIGDRNYTHNDIFEDLIRGEYESTFRKYLYYLKQVAKERDFEALKLGWKYLIEEKLELGNRDPWGPDGAPETLEKVEDLMATDQPNFFFINFVETHAPYSPPRKYVEDPDDEFMKTLAEESPLHLLGQEDEERSEKYCQLYEAEIEYMDSQLERLEEIFEQNSDRETVMIVIGDHGEVFGKEGLWEHHGGIVEDLVKVPLLISTNLELDTEVVELKNIGDIVREVAGLPGQLPTLSKAFSQYDGLQSNLRNFDEFDRKFNQDLYSVFEKDDFSTRSFDDSSDIEFNGE